jgi:hypothetical protein
VGIEDQEGSEGRELGRPCAPWTGERRAKTGPSPAPIAAWVVLGQGSQTKRTGGPECLGTATWRSHSFLPSPTSATVVEFFPKVLNSAHLPKLVLPTRTCRD